jgi:DNA-3-methyladenine glycosylase I
LHYHDTEWGFPVTDDDRLFEKLCLEGLLAGLSWRTVLVKRELCRKALFNFDFKRIAELSPADIEQSLRKAGVNLPQNKIDALANNARRARELAQQHGSLAAFIWSYEPVPFKTSEPRAAFRTDGSLILSRALKRHGWKLAAPTVVQAFMQATGLLNGHAEVCVIRAEAEKARRTQRRAWLFAGKSSERDPVIGLTPPQK